MMQAADHPPCHLEAQKQLAGVVAGPEEDVVGSRQYQYRLQMLIWSMEMSGKLMMQRISHEKVQLRDMRG